jgi:hypothetical protein
MADVASKLWLKVLMKSLQKIFEILYQEVQKQEPSKNKITRTPYIPGNYCAF